jgi:hypothetical protein
MSLLANISIERERAIKLELKEIVEHFSDLKACKRHLK